MVLRRWDPFNELKRMDDTFGRLWRTTHYRLPGPSGEVATYSFPLDLTRDASEVVIRASVPGVDPKDIEVTVGDGVLAIAGSNASEEDAESDGYVLCERRSGRFARSVRPTGLRRCRQGRILLRARRTSGHASQERGRPQ